MARCAFSFWCFYWDLFLFFVCVIRSTICGLSVKISAWFLDLINPRGFHFIYLFFFKGNQSKARSGPDRHWQALLFSPCPAEQTADRRLYREDWKLSWVSISSSSVDTTFNIKPHKNAFDVQSSEIRLRCFLLYLAQIHRLLEDLEGLWNANASKFTCWSAYGTFLKSINNVRYT